MTEIRKPKKSETLEIRLPFDTKRAFMARCQAEGASASEALRGFIEAYVTPSAPSPTWSRSLRWGVGGLAAAAMVAAAAPSLAGVVRHTDRIDAAAFARADLNHDGQLSQAEFLKAFGR